MTETTKEVTEEVAKDTPTVMSTYEKLLNIRLEFHKMGYSRSGKNTHAEFKYLELKDIIPNVNILMEKYKCVFTCVFSNELAKGILVNLENPNDKIIFSFPWAFISEPGKFRMNDPQAIGSCITYYRRYLYFVMLDVIVNDDIEPLIEKSENVSDETPTVEAPKKEAKKKPATPEERKEAKETITAPEEQANELMITGLKNACATLLQKDPSKKVIVEAVKTKTDKFTKVSKATCEQLTLKITALIEELTGIA